MFRFWKIIERSVATVFLFYFHHRDSNVTVLNPHTCPMIFFYILFCSREQNISLLRQIPKRAEGIKLLSELHSERNLMRICRTM